MTPSPAVLSVAEAAAMLRVSPPTLRKIARSGQLPIAVQSPMRIPRAAVEALARGDGWEAPEVAPTPVRERPRPIRRRRHAVPATGYVAALLAQRAG